jgi:hypothetical protein
MRRWYRSEGARWKRIVNYDSRLKASASNEGKSDHDGFDEILFFSFCFLVSSLVNEEEILGGGVGDEAAIGKERMMEDAFGQAQLGSVGRFKRHEANGRYLKTKGRGIGDDGGR